jgi:hypothetical protein
MLEYCKKATHRHEDKEEEELLLDKSSPSLEDSGDANCKAWMSLMKQYRIDAKMSTNNHDENTQTVDKEYNAYITV